MGLRHRLLHGLNIPPRLASLGREYVERRQYMAVLVTNIEKYCRLDEWNMITLGGEAVFIPPSTFGGSSWKASLLVLPRPHGSRAQFEII